MSNSIPLFWWSETRLMEKKKENYGDLLSKYLVEKISGKKVVWIQPKKTPWYRKKKENYLAAGSIIHHANSKSIVWGSGIIDWKQEVEEADFRAVRGPMTRKYLLEKGYNCPDTYGDPAILLPRFYTPGVEKRYKTGIIPHYHDYEQVVEDYGNNKDILVIDLMTLNVEEVTGLILQCERTISSSLHGLIISHSYKIPSVWVKFSDKIFGDDIKYMDYLESVKIPYYEPAFLGIPISRNKLSQLQDINISLPDTSVINKLQNGLLETNPFKQ